MITIDNNLNLEHYGMGLFDTYSEWMHPVISVETYEIIYCVAGEIKIYEGDTQYSVKPDSMLLLSPNITHGGYEKSFGHTSFYWLHFKTNNIERWGLPKVCENLPDGKRILRKMLHYNQSNKQLSEIALAKFLMETVQTATTKNKIAFEIHEYVRINSDKPLSVSKVAEHYGYSPDYISKIYKAQFGESIKSAIIQMRLHYIESLLINTTHSVKEISDIAGFENENDFVKFFKYNKHITPTQFRGVFYDLHKNKK